MRHFYTDTVEATRPTKTSNAHGGESLDWSTEPRSITQCRVQPVSSDETDGRPGITHRLLGPVTIDLRHDDKVSWADPSTGRTLTFHVDGEPLRHRGATAAVAHSETRLRAVDI